jgi:hypothetical protein
VNVAVAPAGIADGAPLTVYGPLNPPMLHSDTLVPPEFFSCTVIDPVDPIGTVPNVALVGVGTRLP